MKIIVIGVGQTLRGDDGAGPEAVRLWQAAHPETVRRLRVETSDLPGLGLLGLLEGMDAALIVDSVQMEAVPPGTLITFGPDEVAAFTPGSQSAHGWGVAETLQLGRELDPGVSSCRVTLIGIAGADFALGAGISPQVRAALGQAVAKIEHTIRGLLEPDS